ncbi:MAG: anti-sigma factor [Streptosporangiaceae bacterium]|nr:anti-sigma factor [Streptosporangiaceae bacterium]
MDAISGRDRATFERHLAGCEECVREIASLREATARLGSATAVTPPARLKERVLAAAAVTRQRPPETAGAEPAAHAGYLGAAARRGAWLRAPAWRRLRLRPRLVLATAAVAAVTAVAAGGTAVVFGLANGSMRQQLDRAQAGSQQIAAVLTARDARMMTGPVAGGGTVTIVMSHSRRALVFTARGLRPLPASRGYELWLVGPGGDRPAGMLPGVSHGMTGPVIASGLHRGDRLALTDEPATGSKRPTAPMMLDVPL